MSEWSVASNVRTRYMGDLNMPPRPQRVVLVMVVTADVCDPVHLLVFLPAESGNGRHHNQASC